jgi:hypothetical protein
LHAGGFELPDSWQYQMFALNLVERGVWSQEFWPPLAPDIQRLPGYGVWLAAWGRHPEWSIWAQHGLVAWTAWRIRCLLLPCLALPVAARWGWVYAFAPLPLLHATFLLTETLCIALWLEALYRLLHGKAAWQAGVWWLMAVLVKGIVLVGTPVVMLALWHRYRYSLRGLVAVAGFTLPVVVGVAAWALRYYSITGMPGLTNQSGANYWYGSLCGAVARADRRATDDATLFRISDSLSCVHLGCVEPWCYPTGVRGQEGAVLRPEARHLADSLLGTSRLYGAAVRQRVQAVVQMLAGIGLGSARHQSGGNPVLTSFLASVQSLLLCTLYTGIGVWFYVIIIRSTDSLRLLDVVLAGLACVWLTTHADPWADGRYRLLVEPALVMLAARGWAGFRFRQPRSAA